MQNMEKLKNKIQTILNYDPRHHEVCCDEFAYDRLVEFYKKHMTDWIKILENSKYIIIDSDEINLTTHAFCICKNCNVKNTFEFSGNDDVDGFECYKCKYTNVFSDSFEIHCHNGDIESNAGGMNFEFGKEYK